MTGRKGKFLHPDTEKFLKDNLYSLSPKELHELSGVSYYTIYQRLKGKTPVPYKKKKEPEVKKLSFERPPSNYSNHRPYDNL